MNFYGQENRVVVGFPLLAEMHTNCRKGEGEWLAEQNHW